MVVCEIAPAVVGLPDDISFGVIHTKKWFPSHAEDVIVGIVALWGGGDYKYPQRAAFAVGCSVNKFQHISIII